MFSSARTKKSIKDKVSCSPSEKCHNVNNNFEWQVTHSCNIIANGNILSTYMSIHYQHVPFRPRCRLPRNSRVPRHGRTAAVPAVHSTKSQLLNYRNHWIVRCRRTHWQNVMAPIGGGGGGVAVVPASAFLRTIVVERNPCRWTVAPHCWLCFFCWNALN